MWDGVGSVVGGRVGREREASLAGVGLDLRTARLVGRTRWRWVEYLPGRWVLRGWV